MFGLPPDIDLGFFNARELLQVCIGANEVILNFDDDLSLTIETELIHRPTAGTATAFKDAISAAPMLSRLINTKVLTALRIDPGTLSLRFSNGDTLDVSDTSSVYESYQIRHGQR